MEHVFTICYKQSARGRRLARDAAVMAEVEHLKAKYLGYAFDEVDRCALCHGDFHPGGVMMRGTSVKVGPPPSPFSLGRLGRLGR